MNATPCSSQSSRHTPCAVAQGSGSDRRTKCACYVPGVSQPNSASRRGYVLILFAMLLFAILGLAALVIDLGMARLTQRQMQTAVQSAALEGLRFRDGFPPSVLTDPTFQQLATSVVGAPLPTDPYNPYDSQWQQWIDLINGSSTTAMQNRDTLRREMASQIVWQTFDGDFNINVNLDTPNPLVSEEQIGAGAVFSTTGGYGSDPTLAASQTLGVGDAAVGQPYRTFQPKRSDGTRGLELNTNDDLNGDMVAGTYGAWVNGTFVNDDVQDFFVAPGEDPMSYSRQDFQPRQDLSPGAGVSAQSFLVRMRRTRNYGGNDLIPDVSSTGPTLPFLFGRGSTIHKDTSSANTTDYSPREQGISVRATAIADTSPTRLVISVGSPVQSGVSTSVEGVSDIAVHQGYYWTLMSTEVAQNVPGVQGVPLHVDNSSANTGTIVDTPLSATGTVGTTLAFNSTGQTFPSTPGFQIIVTNAMQPIPQQLILQTITAITSAGVWTVPPPGFGINNVGVGSQIDVILVTQQVNAADTQITVTMPSGYLQDSTGAPLDPDGIPAKMFIALIHDPTQMPDPKQEYVRVRDFDATRAIWTVDRGLCGSVPSTHTPATVPSVGPIPLAITPIAGSGFAAAQATAAIGDQIQIVAPPSWATLAVGIGASDTTITLQPGSVGTLSGNGFPNDPGNDPAAMFGIIVDTGTNAEVMLVQSFGSDGTWTVERGQDATAATSHLAGTPVALAVGSYVMPAAGTIIPLGAISFLPLYDDFTPVMGGNAPATSSALRITGFGRATIAPGPAAGNVQTFVAAAVHPAAPTSAIMNASTAFLKSFAADLASEPEIQTNLWNAINSQWYSATGPVPLNTIQAPAALVSQ
jgi:hypothetical protein